LSTPLLMLAGGTIGEGLAQSWGSVAGQQNGLWILCLWILRVGGPALPLLWVSLHIHTETHRNTPSPLLSSLAWCCCLGLWCGDRWPREEARRWSFFRISGFPVPRHCEWVPNRPGQARRQEGPAVAHVEPASDWVAVNTNPAADYHWHGEINSNKWTYKAEHTYTLTAILSPQDWSCWHTCTMVCTHL